MAGAGDQGPRERITWRLAWFMAKRNLSASWLSTLLVVGAVGGGLGFQIPVSSNLLGYEAEVLEDGLRAGWGDVRIRPTSDEPLHDADRMAREASADPDVVGAVPMLTLAGAIGKGPRFHATAINGIDGTAPFVPYVVVAGTGLTPGDDRGALVGTAVARRLGIAPGDVVRVRVVFSTGPTALPEENVGRYELQVRGLAGGAFFGHESVFVDRSFLSKEAGLEGDATLLMVHTADHARAGAVAQRLSGKLTAVKASPWELDSSYVRNAVSAVRAIEAATTTMALAAVVIPVLALLAVSVSARRREIAVLSALGFRPREIFGVHLMSAFVVGVAGVAAGTALGATIAHWFQAHPIFDWEGFVLRPVITAEALLRPAASVLAATVVAGVYPAWRAARTDPAKVFKGA